MVKQLAYGIQIGYHGRRIWGLLSLWYQIHSSLCRSSLNPLMLDGLSNYLRKFFCHMMLLQSKKSQFVSETLRTFGLGVLRRTACSQCGRRTRWLLLQKKRREDWLEERPGPSNTTQNEKSWETLWHVAVPAKIRNFLWRLAHNSIPTEDVRNKRNMSTHDRCYVCGTTDSWKHSLIECSMARCVWALGDEEVLEHVLSNRSEDARV